MNTFGTNIYAARHVARYRTDDLIREAEQARLAREVKRTEPTQDHVQFAVSAPRRPRLAGIRRRAVA